VPVVPLALGLPPTATLDLLLSLLAVLAVLVVLVALAGTSHLLLVLLPRIGAMPYEEWDDAKRAQVAADLEMAATFPSQEMRHDLHATPQGPAAGLFDPWAAAAGAGAPSRAQAAAGGAVDCGDEEEQAAFTRAFYHADISARFLQLRSEFDNIVTTAITNSVQQSNAPILATLTTLQKQLSSQHTSIDQQVMSSVRPQFDAMQRQFQEQHDALCRRVDYNERDIEAHAAQLAELQKQVEELRRQNELDRQLPSRPPAPPGFDREIDPTQVIVVSSKLVGLAGVREVVNSLMGELNFSEDDSYTIKALTPLPSKKFAVCFSGPIGLASRRVQKALANLKTDGAWRVFQCPAQ
ncbi:unnamed protein product, partial [Prorocentrum cordatum]